MRPEVVGKGFLPPECVPPLVCASFARILRCRVGRLVSWLQRCWNRGVRFSMKAFIPSFWSSVANSA